jgi:hypothetical protein
MGNKIQRFWLRLSFPSIRAGESWEFGECSNLRKNISFSSLVSPGVKPQAYEAASSIAGWQ